MGDTNSGHPLRDGLSQAEPEVSALRASIPDAGDWFLFFQSFSWGDFGHYVMARADKVTAKLVKFSEGRNNLGAKQTALDDVLFASANKDEVEALFNELAKVEQSAKSAFAGAKKHYNERKLQILHNVNDTVASLIAKAMETGTAKTEGLGAKHDSAVAKPFADKEQ